MTAREEYEKDWAKSGDHFLRVSSKVALAEADERIEAVEMDQNSLITKLAQAEADLAAMTKERDRFNSEAQSWMRRWEEARDETKRSYDALAAAREEARKLRELLLTIGSHHPHLVPNLDEYIARYQPEDQS